MSSSPHESRAACVEDFNEDAQVALPETRQTASTSSTANTAAKRTKPDAGKGKGLRDEFSDSGYSSHTVATLGSGISSSIASKILTVTPKPDDTSADSQITVKDGGRKTPSQPQSPGKSLPSKNNFKSKDTPAVPTKPCDCPKCRRKQPHQPSLSLDTNVHDSPDKTRSKKKRSPLLQRFQRTPRPYPPKETETTDPPPPRSRTTNPHQQAQQRARPMSFHAGSVPEGYMMQQPVFIEQRPPSRLSAASPFPPPSYPPDPSFFPMVPMIPQPEGFYQPMASPYDMQPQQLGAQPWSFERPRPSRPQTMYYASSAPIMEYGQPLYEIPERSSQRVGRNPNRGTGRSVPERNYSQAEDDYRRMPPPPPPPARPDLRAQQEQRPLIRHAVTASAIYASPQYRHTGREQDDDRPSRQPSSRKQSFEEQARSRRPSLGRTHKSSDEKIMQALQLERDMARMKIEPVESSPKSKRRSSVYGRSSLKDLEGSLEAAEAYQASMGNTRGSSTTPLHDELYGLSRKKTQTTSSDGGSRLSGRSRRSREGGSDTKSRRRPSDEDRIHEDDDQLEMRIPKGANIKLQSGMIDGRAVSLKQCQNADGGMELHIGERERGGAAVSRPAIRDKSRKRYSTIGSQAIMEPETSQNIRRNAEEETEPRGGRQRIIRETITTTTRSRRNSGGFFLPQGGGYI